MVKKSDKKNLFCLWFPHSGQNVEVEKRSHFAVVTMKTATTAAVSSDLNLVHRLHENSIIKLFEIFFVNT